MPDAPETKVRGRTGAIGFSGKAGDTLVKSLSGGEKARLLLGLATFFGPNMIILDEPTNHLDIDSRAALAEAINEFPGAVIMVSHDRYLIEACADQLWVVADHTVTSYDGDLDDYRRMVLSARGMRTNSRDRGGKERGGGRDKPAAHQERKAHPAEAEDFGRRSRDRAHQRHHRQDRYRAGAAGSVQARPEAGGPAHQGARGCRRARCSGPRKNGWRRVRNMTKPPAEPGSTAGVQLTAITSPPASSSPSAFAGLRRRHRLRPALDRCQPSGREGIDSGALPLQIVDDRHPVAARIVGEIDAGRRADAAHDIAFGMTERHRSRGRGDRRGSGAVGRGVGVRGLPGGAIPGQ